MPSRRNSIYDAVIIGAGHNGLTAAAYLAREGYSTLVLERRDIVGGCCVTEQIAPGCRASTTSYIASMLPPEAILDLHLAAHRLRLAPRHSALQFAFLDRHYESENINTLFPAHNVYGKHGGPYQPGSALGLLFHLLSGGEHEQQGFYGHVMGGMGSITSALAKAARGFGAEIRTSAAVQQIDSREGRGRALVLEDGTEIRAPVVLSNADPKRTFLGMVPERDLPADFVQAVRGIKMNGPSAKVNLLLAEEPRLTATPASYDSQQRSLFTLVPSLEFAERCYDIAKFREIPEQLWVDCVIASNADPSLAPAGQHVLT